MFEVRKTFNQEQGGKGREPNSDVCEEPILCAPGHALIRQPEHLQSGYSIPLTAVIQRRPRIRG